jgi:hypothetical protein
VARAEVPAAAQENTMKAIAYDKYGSPDVLEFRDVSKGRPAARWAPGCTELNPHVADLRLTRNAPEPHGKSAGQSMIICIRGGT